MELLVAGGALLLTSCNSFLLKRQGAMLGAMESRAAVSDEVLMRALAERECAVQIICELHAVLREMSQFLDAEMLLHTSFHARSDAPNEVETIGAKGRQYATLMQRLVSNMWAPTAGPDPVSSSPLPPEEALVEPPLSTSSRCQVVHALHTGILCDTIRRLSDFLHMCPDHHVHMSAYAQRVLAGVGEPLAEQQQEMVVTCCCKSTVRQLEELQELRRQFLLGSYPSETLRIFQWIVCHPRSKHRRRTIRIYIFDQQKLRTLRKLLSKRCASVHEDARSCGHEPLPAADTRAHALDMHALRKFFLRRYGADDWITMAITIIKDATAEVAVEAIVHMCRQIIFEYMVQLRFPLFSRWHAIVRSARDDTAAMVREDTVMCEQVIDHKYSRVYSHRGHRRTA